MPRDDLRKGRKSLSRYAYHVTLCTHNRLTWFNDFPTARMVVKALRALHDDKSLHSIAWVIMPDHVHLLFQLGQQSDLSAVIKRFKGVSAITINRHLNRKGALWQRGFYDHAVRKEENLKEISRYIIANPLRAGLVENIGDYPLWDAVWL